MTATKRIAFLILALAWTTSMALAGPVVYLLPKQNDVQGKQGRISALEAAPGVVAARTALRAETRFQDTRLNRWIRVELENESALQTIQNSLAVDPGIEIMERAPERTINGNPELDGMTNDPLAGFQWHLDRINAEAAWDLLPDASGVVIAIVDNGVDLDHPDIAPILWTNEDEKYGSTNVDDDQNGYIDDIHGWNSFDGNGNPNAPTDVASADHGTHCAGIAAGAHNNRIGISGVAPGAKIMAVRAGRATSIGNPVEGIIYAIDNGANIISMSFSGGGESVFERDAINYAVQQGVLLVAAAGNEQSRVIKYPAGYQGVLSIAATDIDNELASFSNSGPWVDIAAPGDDILSTVINGYGYLSGTSMATPLVAGVAALIYGSSPDATLDEVRTRLLQGSLPLAETPNSGYPGRRVDAWRTALSDRPTLIIHSISIDDDSENGVLEAGEAADVHFHIELTGTEAANVSFNVNNTTNNVTISGGNYWDGLEPGEYTATYIAVAESSADRGFETIEITINVNGYQETRMLELPLNPPWRVHDAGEMIATVTDFGAIGYRDYVHNMDHPEGIRLLNQKTGMLFHGSVMVSDGINVSDCAFGNDFENQYDFFTTSGGEIERAVSQPSAMVYTAQYTDGAASGTAGVLVNQTTTSYPDGDDILYMDLNVTPIDGGSGDYFAGIYTDWDVGDTYNNTVRYDAGSRLIYTLGSAGAAGVMVLGTGTISGVYAVSNQDVVYGGFSDEEKLGLMVSGTSNAQLSISQDVSQLIAIRMANVSTQSPGTARFAILAAESEQALLGLAGKASLNTVSNNQPNAFTLGQAWPNPFNASTMFTVTMPKRGELTVSVYDVLGRLVAKPVDEVRTAGVHQISWNSETSSGQPVSSGSYFLRAQWNGQLQTKRVILIR